MSLRLLKAISTCLAIESRLVAACSAQTLELRLGIPSEITRSNREPHEDWRARSDRGARLKYRSHRQPAPTPAPGVQHADRLHRPFHFHGSGAAGHTWRRNWR